MPTAVVLREATRPRAATGSASVADVGAGTKGAAGKVTAGSLARMEWESLFQRHFIQPDQVENEVESAHARYLYSRTYGWIDTQHFFAHIQYAEESGPAAAAAKGIDIEVSQQRVRNLIGPVPDDNTAYSDLLEHDLIDFFAMIEVLDDPAAVKRAAAGLPARSAGRRPR
jgi:hypothetical protein